MDFDKLKGIASRVTEQAQDATAWAGETAGAISEAAAAAAMDRMLTTLELATERVRRGPLLNVPSVSLTATLTLGVVQLSASVAVPLGDGPSPAPTTADH